MKLYHGFQGDWDQLSLGITRKTSWENVGLSLAIKGSNGEKMKIAYIKICRQGQLCAKLGRRGKEKFKMQSGTMAMSFGVLCI